MNDKPEWCPAENSWIVRLRHNKQIARQVATARLRKDEQSGSKKRCPMGNASAAVAKRNRSK